MSYVFNPFTGTLDWIADRKTNQTPAETPNGSITVFTLPNSDNYMSGTLEVMLNGLQEVNYTESSSTTFTLSTAPITGDIIKLCYNLA